MGRPVGVGTRERAAWNVRRILTTEAGPVRRGDLLARLSQRQREFLDVVLDGFGAHVSVEHQGRYVWVGPVGATPPSEPPAGIWRGGTPSYMALHQRLKTAFGPASSHACISCAGTANTWAYDHLDPDEVIGTRKAGGGGPVVYSVHLNHYQPMCFLCHNRLDAQHRHSR